MFDPDDGTKAVARECLASFPDATADAAITELIQSDDSEARRVGTELISHRRTDLAVPTLLKVASEDEVEDIRLAALTSLRELADYDDLEALLALLPKTDSEAITKAVKHALVVVCTRYREADTPPPPECVDPLIAALGKSSGPAKAALIDVLRRVGGTKADEAIRRAGSE